MLRAKNSAKVDASLIALKGGLEYQQQVFDFQGLLGPEKGLVPIMGSRKKPAPTTENPDPKVYTPGEVVYKMGYRTGSKRGIISAIEVVSSDATLDEDLGPYRPAPINSFLVDAQTIGDATDKVFAEPGDSGSVLIADSDKKVIGLLWGGRSKKDPTSPWIIVESHGLIDPIDVVEAEMNCEVLTFDSGSPTQTVDGNNLDGVPHIDEEGNPVVEGASTPQRAAGILEMLRQRSKGERLARTAERAAREVMALLHHNDRVRAAWLINGGPTLAGAFLRGLESPHDHVPSQVRDLPIQQCAGRLFHELSRAGSAELRTELGLLMPFLDGARDRTFEDLLDGVETSL